MKDAKIARAAQANIAGLLNRYSMEHAKPETCKHCGGPVGRKNSIGVDMQPIHTHDAPVPGG